MQGVMTRKQVKTDEQEHKENRRLKGEFVSYAAVVRYFGGAKAARRYCRSCRSLGDEWVCFNKMSGTNLYRLVKKIDESGHTRTRKVADVLDVMVLDHQPKTRNRTQCGQVALERLAPGRRIDGERGRNAQRQRERERGCHRERERGRER